MYTPPGLGTIDTPPTDTNVHGHHRPECGYTASKKQLNTRLARIEGQVRGLQKMVEGDRYCIDVITQISAVQAALDKVALGLLADHADHCIVHGHGGKSPQANSEELMSAVARLVKR